MKLTKFKKLFKSKNKSQTTSSHSSKKPATGSSTPTTVLPSPSADDDWSYSSADGGDGRVSKEELARLLRRLGADEDELRSMMTAADGDGDGDGVSVEKLCGGGGGELREAFDFFDGDGDGRITAEELFRVFQVIGEEDGCTLEECRRMIREVDRNGDGFVCFEDFTRMMELQQS